MQDTPTRYAEAVAAEVRAEMAKQRKRQGDLAQVLGIGSATAGRRLSGERPFDVQELVQVAAWLGVEVSQFMRPVTSMTRRVSA